MNSEKLSPNGITVFIDILGFSERVLNAKLEDITEIERDISSVQTIFEHNLEVNSRSKADFEMHQLSQKTVLAFSDCVVIHVPFTSAATNSDGIAPIIGEINVLAISQAECISEEGIFMRGAIDIGWWYQNKSTLISPSFIRAYRMECKVKYPIIAFTNDVFKYLLKQEQVENIGEKYPNVYLLKDIFRTEIMGENTIHYLDYINVVCADFSKLEDTEIWLSKHAKKIKIAHGKAPTTAKNKYEWLANYHNEVVNERGLNESCLCDLPKAISDNQIKDVT